MTDPSTPSAALPPLSTKHEKFKNLYLGECLLNATAAARAAGFKNPREGWRLLQRPDIRAHIAAHLEGDADIMTAREVARRLTDRARQVVDMTEFVTVAATPRSYWVPMRGHRPVHDYAKRKGVAVEDLDVTDLANEFGWDAVSTTLDGETQIRVSTLAQEVDFDWQAALEAGAFSAFESFKRREDGAYEYKVRDTSNDLQMLGKMHALFTEKVEHSGQLGIIGIDIVPPDGAE